MQDQTKGAPPSRPPVALSFMLEVEAMTRHGHVGAFAHIAADAKWATTGPAISEWQSPMWIPDGGQEPRLSRAFLLEECLRISPRSFSMGVYC